jgi:hypothetical protein
MTMWKRWSMAAAIVAGSVCLVLAQAPETYKARLSPLPADAKTRPDLAGSGTVTAVLTGTKLAINGSFEGLKTAAVGAQLHNGVAAGVRGPVIQDLTIAKAVSGTITGSVDLSAAQIANLKKGGLYVQLASEKTPDGTLWGWFLK